MYIILYISIFIEASNYLKHINNSLNQKRKRKEKYAIKGRKSKSVSTLDSTALA